MVTRTEGLVVKDHVYTVSQVTEIVKTALETAFPQVWVEGEVSGYKKAASGHVFFNLKDDRCVIKAVMWQSTARKVAFDVKDGLQVVCRGKISVYEPRGDYQLYVDQVEPKGKGALQLRFEQLKEKLKAEGLFDEARKRKLPLRPRTIGVVTSPTGAAIRDILRVLAGFGPPCVGLTLGEAGSAFMYCGEVVEVPGFPVDVVDTTGAGDVFHGAFLYGLLRGWEARDILQFANAVSALKCTRLGGRTGIPRIEDVWRFLAARGCSVPIAPPRKEQSP
jgi:hypothetical protein